MKKIEEDVLRDLEKEMNWKEKIFLKIFAKMFYKVYNAGVKRGFNWNNKI